MRLYRNREQRKDGQAKSWEGEGSGAQAGPIQVAEQAGILIRVTKEECWVKRRTALFLGHPETMVEAEEVHVLSFHSFYDLLIENPSFPFMLGPS